MIPPTAMETASSKLISHWRSLNFLIAPGNSEQTIREFESRKNVIFPPDFREYLLSVNGMLQAGGYDCDPNGFAFWPLSFIKSVREESLNHSSSLPEVQDLDEHFVFVDYLQWCWAYAIRLTPRPSDGGQVIHVGKLHPKVIASSFTEFVDLYLGDDVELYTDGVGSAP
jgi:SMI1/KNR4 family protein SUKH-1